jgi:hypothetical protein
MLVMPVAIVIDEVAASKSPALVNDSRLQASGSHIAR